VTNTFTLLALLFVPGARQESIEMRDFLQNAAMKAVDQVVAGIPQPVPDQVALRRCKIISHRGEHDNMSVIENTLPAFDNARVNGVWAIECDVRWTADLVPVICHDPCGQRLFGNPARVSELTFVNLRAKMPLIPSLAELLGKFGGNTHLMLEIKAEHYPRPQRQKAILQEQLSTLSPGLDYHFLALDPELFARVDFVPRKACVPVAQFNTARLSRAALETGCGGLTGHFLLLTDKLKQRHELAGQRVGTGFISSKNCLFRELNRGIEWIFSNDAVRIQKIRDRYLE
jgi:glycerophosphoryl diester phosphodiesterase